MKRVGAQYVDVRKVEKKKKKKSLRMEKETVEVGNYWNAIIRVL